MVADFSNEFVTAMKFFCDRKPRGIYSAIADYIQCTPSHVTRIKNGNAGSEKTRRKIAEFFGYQYEEFLGIGKRLLDGEEIKLREDIGIDDVVKMLESINAKIDHLYEIMDERKEQEQGKKIMGMLTKIVRKELKNGNE
jgi:hypothetical protein